MQIQIYKAIFFNVFLLSVCIFSCNRFLNKSNEEIPVTSEDILATLSKTPDKNYFDFEIENVKYTLLEIKQEGGNSLYIFHATGAETWQEHESLRNKAIFNITFEFQQDFLYMKFMSNGFGYSSIYNVLDGTVYYEKEHEDIMREYKNNE